MIWELMITKGKKQKRQSRIDPAFNTNKDYTIFQFLVYSLFLFAFGESRNALFQLHAKAI
jgi:hypothetical protein